MMPVLSGMENTYFPHFYNLNCLIKYFERIC